MVNKEQKLIDKTIKAEELKTIRDTISEWSNKIGKDYLRSVSCCTDTAEAKEEYKASCRLLEYIDSQIADGKWAEKKLERGKDNGRQ